MSNKARHQTWNVQPGIQTALSMPDNTGSTVIRFEFTGSNLPSYAPITIIYRRYYLYQIGYYCNFFWSSRTEQDFINDITYYGCHPYPQGGFEGTTHNYEISAEGDDWITGDGGWDTSVVFNTWRTEGVRVFLNAGKPVVQYYPNLGTASPLAQRLTYNFANTFDLSPTYHSLSFLSSPWPGLASNPFPPRNPELTETAYGYFRGLQIFGDDIGETDMVTESQNGTLNAAQTGAGQVALHYMNQYPTPSDISDKSGRGHSPDWVGAGRPALFTL